MTMQAGGKSNSCVFSGGEGGGVQGGLLVIISCPVAAFVPAMTT